MSTSPNQDAPRDKLENRTRHNFLSASAMLGHLCALYDRGVFESGRLMSNLLFQLAVKRKPTNTPLLEQVGLWSNLQVVVDEATVAANTVQNAPMSPLLDGLVSGLRTGADGGVAPAAHWITAMQKPEPVKKFVALPIDTWLDDPVIPTTQKMLSRKDLIVAVRDQDGGAHSDTDTKLQKSIEYIELVNSFPISKFSSTSVSGQITKAWDLVPPVTMPLLRQISHELLSAIYSQTDIRECFYLTSIVCTFRGTELLGAFVPEGYADVGPVHGKTPAIIPRR